MHTRFGAENVIFDLDGTLIDTAPDLTRALNHVLEIAGRPAVTVAAARHMVGAGARAMICFGLEGSGGLLPEAEIDNLFDIFLEHYGQNIAVDSTLFPGVRRYLERLAGENVGIALCTNKPVRLTMALMDALELSESFDVIIGGDSLGVRKPDPGPVLETVARLGGTPERTLFIGDSEIDFQAARAAGTPIALVDFGYCRSPVASLGADAIISSYEDLL